MKRHLKSNSCYSLGEYRAVQSVADQQFINASNGFAWTKPGRVSMFFFLLLLSALRLATIS